MLRMERPTKPRQMENTITLINIVFLMLIFFLIAGTIAPTTAPDVEAIKTTDAEEAQQEKMLGIRADGTLIYEGRETSVDAYLAALNAESLTEREGPIIRLLPDRALPANTLLDIVSSLQKAGGGKIVVFSERALQ